MQSCHLLAALWPFMCRLRPRLHAARLGSEIGADGLAWALGAACGGAGGVPRSCPSPPAPKVWREPLVPSGRHEDALIINFCVT